MTLRKASASLILAAAALLSPSGVRSSPATAFTPEPPQPPPYPPQAAATPIVPQPRRAAGAYDALVAPIALYPDPLIALLLPASTVPADLVAASSYLIRYGDATRIDAQPWDPSVRALAHYPTVVAWMAENMAWTQALGAAFLSSPSEVMDAIQRLRSRALAAGALASTPQQQVVSDGGEIEIYPAQPDSIYIPVYDDSVVYSEDDYSGFAGAFINFGNPYPAGPWLSFYFDWGEHRVWSGGQSVWHDRKGWQPLRSGGGHPPPGAHPWRPPAPGATPSPASHGPRADVAALPRPMPGAPSPPPERFRRPAVPAGPTGTHGSEVPVPRTAPPLVELPRLLPPAGAMPPQPAPVHVFSPAPAVHPEPVHVSAPAPAPAPNSVLQTQR